jgi:hypothetical protein
MLQVCSLADAATGPIHDLKVVGLNQHVDSMPLQRIILTTAWRAQDGAFISDDFPPVMKS